jgi:hypothetical protein
VETYKRTFHIWQKTVPAIGSFLLAALVHSGCSQYVDIEPSAADREQREAVLSYLASVNETDLLSAFSELNNRQFSQTIVTQQLDDSGQELARDERVIVQSETGGVYEAHVLAESADDTFDFGSVSGFFGRAAGESEPSLFEPYDLPEDRGYNNPRHQNKYVYRFGRSSELNGRSTRTIQISVMDRAREEVFVQGVEIVVDDEAARVISISMDIRVESLLFSERSSILLSGDLVPDGSIVPLGYTLKTRMNAVLSNPVVVQIRSDFSFPDESR